MGVKINCEWNRERVARYFKVLSLNLPTRARVSDIRGPVFDSRRYNIFRVAVSLERGALSLVRINEELLERNSSFSSLENGRGGSVALTMR
jgi:hypothetical protein